MSICKKRKKKKRISLAKKYSDDFAPQIRMRGKDYNERGNVIRCLKVDAYTYYVDVEGSDGMVYCVTINLKFYDDFPDYRCDCPCDYPCKHIYAVLLAINHHDYKTPFLKRRVKPKDYDLQKVLKSIHAKKLKEFMVREANYDSFTFNINKFRKEFFKLFSKRKI